MKRQWSHLLKHRMAHMALQPGLQSVQSLCFPQSISVQPVTPPRTLTEEMACSCLLERQFSSPFIVTDLLNRLRGIPKYIPAMTQVPHFIGFCLSLSGPVRMLSSQRSLQFHHTSRVSTSYKWQRIDVAHSPLTQSCRWSGLRKSAAGWKGSQAKRRSEGLNGKCT